MRAVGIIGTGQSAFTKSRSDVTYPELVREGAELALADAGVTMADVGAVVFPLAPDALIGVGNGERWCVEALGAQGKPFMRVNTGGATGLTAVVAGYVHVASGLFDVVLVAGADRVSESRSPQSVLNKMWDVAYERPFPLNTITMLALAAQRYNARYGADERDLARVTVKNRRHAALNPHAHLRIPITEDEVLATRMISWPLKLADLCPSSTGAGAVVLASEEFARRNGRPVAWIRGAGQSSETFWMGDRVGPAALGDHADADALGEAMARSYRRPASPSPASNSMWPSCTRRSRAWSCTPSRRPVCAPRASHSAGWRTASSPWELAARSSTPPAAHCAPTRSPSPGWSGRPRSPCRSPAGPARPGPEIADPV